MIGMAPNIPRGVPLVQGILVNLGMGYLGTIILAY